MLRSPVKGIVEVEGVRAGPVPRGSVMPSDDSISRRTLLRGAVLAPAALWTGSRFAFAQVAGSEQYRPVQSVALPLDRPGVWTLNFAYTPIRIVTMDTPDRGKHRVWYMVYQVWNKTDLPRRITPEFELVTKDAPAVYLDEMQPSVVKKIREIEDPTGELNLQTSISISKNPIPITKPDSVPRAIHGVAVWLDVVDKSPKTNVFSVYITGLSDGLARTESDDGIETISRKTLQIDFSRPTDERRAEIGDIRPFDNNGLGAEKWIYRPTSRKKAPAKPVEAKEEKN